MRRCGWLAYRLARRSPLIWCAPTRNLKARGLPPSNDRAASRHGVHLFAYPWGRTSGLRASPCRRYRYGFAGDHSPLTATSDPFALPRINVANGYSRDDLAAILRGDWDYLCWLARAKAVMG